MNRLQELWQSFKSQFMRLIQKLEESAFFERIMLKFESLTPKAQKTIQMLSKLFVVLLVVVIFVFPLISLFLARSKLATLQDLKSDIVGFQSTMNRAQLTIAPPAGWKKFESSSINAFQTSFVNYISGIGMPSDVANVSIQGSSLRVKIEELNIRQLTNLSFQVEGLYPGAQFEKYSVSIHPDVKESLTFTGTINLNTQLAQKIAQAGPASPGRGGGASRSKSAVQRPQSRPPPIRPSRQRNTPPPRPEPSLPAPSRREAPRNDDFRDDPYDDVEAPDPIGAPGPPGGGDFEDEFPHPEDEFGDSAYDEGLGMPDDYPDADIPPDMIPPPPPIFEEDE